MAMVASTSSHRKDGMVSICLLLCLPPSMMDSRENRLKVARDEEAYEEEQQAKRAKHQKVACSLQLHVLHCCLAASQ